MQGLSIGITGSDRFLMGDLQTRTKLAKKLADSEIDHLFVADHVSFHTGLGMDALINAATLAAMLPKMTIVTGVYLLALRHPVNANFGHNLPRYVSFLRFRTVRGLD